MVSKQLVWTRDEVILALELYRDDPKCKGRSDHPKVIALSDLLRSLPIYPAELQGPTFRNPDGVGLKLSNLARFDTGSGKQGMRRGSRVDEEVWHEFANDVPRLKATAAAIRGSLSNPESAFVVPDEEEEEASEGRLLTRMHKHRERSRGIVSRKKQDFLNKHGRLFCEACEFDFRMYYGERGEGFIEVHHTVPISALDGRAKTKLSELRLVCSNCHRIIHRSRPWLTWNELTEIVRQARA